jgi:hypothetical protein
MRLVTPVEAVRPRFGAASLPPMVAADRSSDKGTDQ